VDNRLFGSNIGGSPARIKSSSFTTSAFEKGLPPSLSYIKQDTREPFSLHPGEVKKFSIALEEELINLFRMLGTTGPNLAFQKTAHVYFFGYVQYADDVGILRNIAACRHYQTDSGRFMAVDDTEYEYAD
jgi:hypothetical protein